MTSINDNGFDWDAEYGQVFYIAFTRYKGKAQAFVCEKWQDAVSTVRQAVQTKVHWNPDLIVPVSDDEDGTGLIIKNETIYTCLQYCMAYGNAHAFNQVVGIANNHGIDEKEFATSSLTVDLEVRNIHKAIRSWKVFTSNGTVGELVMCRGSWDEKIKEMEENDRKSK